MKRKLHLFSLLFLAAFLLAPVRTMAQVTIGDYTYTFSGDDATITASSLTSGDIVIPTTVSYNGKTYNVTAISFSSTLFKGAPTSIKGESIKSIVGNTTQYDLPLCSQFTNCVSIDFPQLVLLKRCSLLFDDPVITSIYFPELKNIDACQNLFRNLSALSSIRLPKLVTIKKCIGVIYELPTLQVLDIPELTSIDGNDAGDNSNVFAELGLQTFNAPKLQRVFCKWFLSHSKTTVVNLSNGCELATSGMLSSPDASVSSITVNGATKISNDHAFITYGLTTLEKISLPDVEELFDFSLGTMCTALKEFNAPKLKKLVDTQFMPYTPCPNLTKVDIHNMEELANSQLFYDSPITSLTLRGNLKADANSRINLKTYPTVVTITDEGTVNDIPASAFANVKGGRFVVPKGKAALYTQKWNLNTGKTMVYAPVDLKKTTAGTLYASGSITKADDSFTYGGTVYNNQYDFSHAMTEAECKNPSVLGDNDLGFTPTLSSLTVQNNTNALAGYNFYYASAYADSPTQAKVGDLTLTALPSDNAGTLQGFGTAAAQLNKGVSRAMGGFLFRGNSASVDEVYLPYTPSAVSLTTNLLQAGGGVTVKSRSGSNYDFYWHPGNAAYAAGFYECDNTMIPEYRASLSFPKTWSSNAKQFRLIFEDGETTGIESIVLPSDNARTADPEAWYTLLGTRLPAKPATAGVYIHGGRKVVVK